jgi:hypothetical protein
MCCGQIIAAESVVPSLHSILQAATEAATPANATTTAAPAPTATTTSMTTPTTTVATVGAAATEEERTPCIGAVLLAVNGVRTQGLSFQNVLDLLQTQQVVIYHI